MGVKERRATKKVAKGKPSIRIFNVCFASNWVEKGLGKEATRWQKQFVFCVGLDEGGPSKKSGQRQMDTLSVWAIGLGQPGQVVTETEVCNRPLPSAIPNHAVRGHLLDPILLLGRIN